MGLLQFLDIKTLTLYGFEKNSNYLNQEKIWLNGVAKNWFILLRKPVVGSFSVDMDIHRCKSAYWTITQMRKIEYGIDTFGLEKTSIFHSPKKKKNVTQNLKNTNPKHTNIIYIYICVFDCGGCFSPIFWGLPYFSAPGAWAKLSKFLCLLSRSLSLRSLRLPIVQSTSSGSWGE